VKKFLSTLSNFLKPIFIKIAHIQAKVILTLLYLILIAPLGILMRMLTDMLGTRRQSGPSSYWVDRRVDEDIERFSRRQY
jgi:hypothetical protein